MRLSDALLRQIAAEFAEDDRSAVELALGAYGAAPHEREAERVQRDILILAKGDMKEVQALLEKARRDYRNILFWAEYPRESMLDTPEKENSFNEMCRRFGASLHVPPPDARDGGA